MDSFYPDGKLKDYFGKCWPIYETGASINQLSGEMEEEQKKRRKERGETVKGKER